MPRKPTPKPDDSEQSKRFIETAPAPLVFLERATEPSAVLPVAVFRVNAL